MTDPFNPTLIAEYMAWEKANAIKQIEEVERLAKEHRARRQHSGKSRSSKMKTILAALLTLIELGS